MKSIIMQRLLLFICIVLTTVLVSCGDDESPEPSASGQSKVIGNTIYTIISGNNQEGASGQLLPDEIKIVIRDLEGNIVRKNLDFELSDESGIFEAPYGYYSDTLALRWKLGCEQVDQKIHVRDLNVCDIAKSGCVEVDVFDISASATGEISGGWYTPCFNFSNFNFRQLLVNDERLTIIGRDNIISTSDVTSDNWSSTNLPGSINTYGRFDMLSSGEIFYNYYDRYLSSEDATFWKNISLPVNGNNTDMEVNDNGVYYFIEKYDNWVYKSTDGESWSEFINTYDLADNRPQALVYDDGNIYILVGGNKVLKVNEAEDVQVIELYGSAWGRYDFYGDIDVEVSDNQVFVVTDDFNSRLIVGDLNTSTLQSYDISYGDVMYKSNGKIYLLSSLTEFYEWTGSNLNARSLSEPFIWYGIEGRAIFQGAPLGYGYNSIYYYIH